MLQKSRGIVLHTVKYSDTSLIIQMYTEISGVQSFLARGIRSPKSKIKAGLFQPLNLLQMDYYQKPGGGLQNFREVHPDYIFTTIPFDIRKSTVALFLSEILHRSLQEESASPSLFRFLHDGIQYFDREQNPGNAFHLHFLIRLALYFGFLPDVPEENSKLFFDMQEGLFHSAAPNHEHVLNSGMTALFLYLIRTPLMEQPIHIPSGPRDELLLKILDYYRLHLPAFGQIHSLGILQEVFSAPDAG